MKEYKTIEKFYVHPFWKLYAGEDDIIELFLKASKATGIANINLGPFYSGYLLNKPEYIRHVMLENRSNYINDTLFSKQVISTVGPTLLSSLGGEEWLTRRRIMQKAFNNESLKKFAKLASDAASETIIEWKTYALSSEPIDIQEKLSEAFVILVVRILLGVDLRKEDPRLKTAIISLINYISDVVHNRWFFPTWLPLPKNIQFLKDVSFVNNFVYPLIESKRKENSLNEKSDTIADLLINSKLEDSGVSLTDKQLRDEICTLFVAGYDTVLGSICWTLYAVFTNNEVEKKLRKECKEVLGNKPPSIEDLESLTYTDMVVKEAIRLYPAIFGLIRETLDDDFIDGYHIPKGSKVFACPFTMHRQEEYWDKPNEFIPERFSAEEEARRHSCTYFPFGAGPRLCIGKPLALTEIKLFLVNIIQSLSLDLVKEHPVVMTPNIGLIAKHGIKMNVHVL